MVGVLVRRLQVKRPRFTFRNKGAGTVYLLDCSSSQLLPPRFAPYFFRNSVDVALVNNVGTGVNNRWHLFASRQVIHRVYHFYPNFVGTLPDQYAGISFLQEAQLLRKSVERNDY